ncbi:proline-rich protein 36-like [Rhagoletis pomonella]|uniref:proline-rich protein 36-like n=1 Tax=Rhagoletis pomonella TaxID=28610 RepID=UPI00177B666E|nr:proline-rich protein 36-like [Rhagoletis pomonella]
MRFQTQQQQQQQPLQQQLQQPLQQQQPQQQMVSGNAALGGMGMGVSADLGVGAPVVMLPDANAAADTTPPALNNIHATHLTNNDYTATDGCADGAQSAPVLHSMPSADLPLAVPIYNSVAPDTSIQSYVTTQSQLPQSLPDSGTLFPHLTPTLPTVSTATGGIGNMSATNYLQLTLSQHHQLAQLQMNSNGIMQLPPLPPLPSYNTAAQSPLPPPSLLPPASAISTSPQPSALLPLIMPPTSITALSQQQQQQLQQPQLSPLMQSSIMSPQQSSNHAPTAAMQSPRASTPTLHSPQTMGSYSQSQSPAAHQFGALSPMSQCGTPQPLAPPPLNIHAVQEAKEKLKQEKKEKHATKKLIKELAICKTLLGEMELHEDSWPFLLPVNTKQFPTYRKIIKNPMDLSTIKKRIQDLTYKSREDFCVDVRQIFDNCEMFNEDDSPVGKAGHGMRKFFELRWTELTDKHS